MGEVEYAQPSFSEIIDYVLDLAKQVEAAGINLLQPIGSEQTEAVLQAIDASDDRLKAGLEHIVKLGMLDKIKSSLNSNYGDKKIGASCLRLLDIYSANTYKK